MQNSEIHVAQISNGTWTVSKVIGREPTMAFTVKGHAVAFGRALAFSGSRRLFVRGADGIAVLQTEASLTYPLLLD